MELRTAAWVVVGVVMREGVVVVVVVVKVDGLVLVNGGRVSEGGSGRRVG